MSFSTEVELSLTVPSSELKSARSQIEDGIGSASVGTASAATDGGSTSGRRMQRWARRRTSLMETSVGLLSSINESLEDAGGLVGGQTQGGGGPSTTIVSGGGGGIVGTLTKSASSVIDIAASSWAASKLISLVPSSWGASSIISIVASKWAAAKVMTISASSWAASGLISIGSSLVAGASSLITVGAATTVAAGALIAVGSVLVLDALEIVQIDQAIKANWGDVITLEGSVPFEWGQQFQESNPEIASIIYDNLTGKSGTENLQQIQETTGSETVAPNYNPNDVTIQQGDTNIEVQSDPDQMKSDILQEAEKERENDLSQLRRTLERSLGQ